MVDETIVPREGLCGLLVPQLLKNIEYTIKDFYHAIKMAIYCFVFNNFVNSEEKHP
jgi:hypothetical protein